MNTIPELASLQNCLDGEKGGYRCREARTLRSPKEYSLPDCEFQLVKKGIDTYSIRSIANNEYFNSSIGTMAPTDDSAHQHWKILQVAQPNIYTIQNVWNHGYMTAKAGHLHDVKSGEQPGVSEHWYIESLVPDASTSSWMTRNWELIGNRSLDRICLPGSHDSGTFNEKMETMFASERNTRTQLFDIRLQLMQGIRVFDLRPAYYDGQFYTAHYSNVAVFGPQGAIGVSLASAFDQVAAFAAEEGNSKELIILNFSHFSTWASPEVYSGLSEKNEQAFRDLVRQKLSSWLVCGTPDALLARTLDELITGGGESRGNVIAVSTTFGPDGTQTRLGLWNKSYFPTRGGYSHSSEVPAMAATQLKNLRTFSHADSKFIFELCWQLTLSDMGSTPLGGHSIVGLADVANPELSPTVMKWMTGIEPVITTDHYPNAINTDACLESVTQAVQLSISINKMLGGEEIMAGWVFSEVTRNKIDEVYAELQNQLNMLAPAASNSVKVTVSDMKGSLARGVLFFNGQDGIPERPTAKNWQYQKWHTKGKYDELYRNVATQLNALSAGQAYYSLLCMTNVKGQDETLALYWLA